MKTTIKELDQWIRTPREGENLQFKGAKNQFDSTN
jgi:hypothetical protein